MNGLGFKNVVLRGTGTGRTWYVLWESVMVSYDSGCISILSSDYTCSRSVRFAVSGRLMSPQCRWVTLEVTVPVIFHGSVAMLDAAALKASPLMGDNLEPPESFHGFEEPSSSKV